MNTQAAMMLIIILANLLVMMAGLKRLRQYQLAQYQKMKYEKEGLKTDATGNDKPPSYDKVVVTEETDTKA